MAVGILSVGMMLIATMFPVAIYLTTVASERTMAAIVADEAFAKIQLYGFISADANLYKFCFDYEYELVKAGKIDPNEFSYPSVDPVAGNKQYYWSALCKKSNTDPASNDTEYLVTVFVARKTSPNLTYPYPSGPLDNPRPIPVQVEHNLGLKDNEIKISNSDLSKARYVNPPAVILYNVSGRLYRVVDKVDDTTITLDRAWVEDTNNYIPPRNFIWLVPPPLTGGRNADIEVYQRIMRF